MWAGRNSFFCHPACADLEGDGGWGPPPPLEFAKLIITVFSGKQNISYFSYLYTSTVLRQSESIHKITIK